MNNDDLQAGELGFEGKHSKRIPPKHLMHKHLCHLLFLLPNVAKHIQLNDSPERFLVDYRGYLQADAFRRYTWRRSARRSRLSTSSTRRRKTVSSGQAGRMAISPCLGTRFPSSYLVSRSFWPSSVALFTNP